jgi:hypothetical protein
MMKFRLLLALPVLMISFLGLIGNVSAQETKTITAAEFNAAVDHMCARARAKELAYDRLRIEADRLAIQGAECTGALAESRIQIVALHKKADLLRLERDRRWSTWVVVVVAATGFVAGGAVVLIAK